MPPARWRMWYKRSLPAAEVPLSGIEHRTITAFDSVNGNEPQRQHVAVMDPRDHRLDFVRFTEVKGDWYGGWYAWPGFEVPEYWKRDSEDQQAQPVDTSRKRYALSLIAQPDLGVPLPYENAADFVTRINVVQSYDRAPARGIATNSSVIGSSAEEVRLQTMYATWMNANSTIFRPSHDRISSVASTLRKILTILPKNRAAMARWKDCQWRRQDTPLALDR